LKVVVDNMWGNGAGWLSEILGGGATEIIEVHAERNPIFPEMSRPEPIPLQVLAGAIEPLHADDPTLPDQVLLASRGKVLQGSYKLCIAADGKVQSVTPVVGIEGVDRCVVETLKTWQFPKLPVLLCKLQTLRFEIP
jgi:phosphomannomutase